jgi:hypothetical protein
MHVTPSVVLIRGISSLQSVPWFCRHLALAAVSSDLTGEGQSAHDAEEFCETMGTTCTSACCPPSRSSPFVRSTRFCRPSIVVSVSGRQTGGWFDPVPFKQRVHEPTQ